MSVTSPSSTPLPSLECRVPTDVDADEFRQAFDSMYEQTSFAGSLQHQMRSFVYQHADIHNRAISSSELLTLLTEADILPILLPSYFTRLFHTLTTASPGNLKSEQPSNDVDNNATEDICHNGIRLDFDHFLKSIALVSYFLLFDDNNTYDAAKGPSDTSSNSSPKPDINYLLEKGVQIIIQTLENNHDENKTSSVLSTPSSNTSTHMYFTPASCVRTPAHRRIMDDSILSSRNLRSIKWYTPFERIPPPNFNDTEMTPSASSHATLSSIDPSTLTRSVPSPFEILTSAASPTGKLDFNMLDAVGVPTPVPSESLRPSNKLFETPAGDKKSPNPVSECSAERDIHAQGALDEDEPNEMSDIPVSVLFTENETVNTDDVANERTEVNEESSFDEYECKSEVESELVTEPSTPFGIGVEDVQKSTVESAVLGENFSNMAKTAIGLNLKYVSEDNINNASVPQCMEGSNEIDSNDAVPTRGPVSRVCDDSNVVTSDESTLKDVHAPETIEDNTSNELTIELQTERNGSKQEDIEDTTPVNTVVTKNITSKNDPENGAIFGELKIPIGDVLSGKLNVAIDVIEVKDGTCELSASKSDENKSKIRKTDQMERSSHIDQIGSVSQVGQIDSMSQVVHIDNVSQVDQIGTVSDVKLTYYETEGVDGSIDLEHLKSDNVIKTCSKSAPTPVGTFVIDVPQPEESPVLEAVDNTSNVFALVGQIEDLRKVDLLDSASDTNATDGETEEVDGLIDLEQLKTGNADPTVSELSLPSFMDQSLIDAPQREETLPEVNGTESNTEIAADSEDNDDGGKNVFKIQPNTVKLNVETEHESKEQKGSDIESAVEFFYDSSKETVTSNAMSQVETGPIEFRASQSAIISTDGSVEHSSDGFVSVNLPLATSTGAVFKIPTKELYHNSQLSDYDVDDNETITISDYVDDDKDENDLDTQEEVAVLVVPDERHEEEVPQEEDVHSRKIELEPEEKPPTVNTVNTLSPTSCALGFVKVNDEKVIDISSPTKQELSPSKELSESFSGTPSTNLATPNTNVRTPFKSETTPSSHGTGLATFNSTPTDLQSPPDDFQSPELSEPEICINIGQLTSRERRILRFLPGDFNHFNHGDDHDHDSDCSSTYSDSEAIALTPLRLDDQTLEELGEQVDDSELSEHEREEAKCAVVYEVDAGDVTMDGDKTETGYDTSFFESSEDILANAFLGSGDGGRNESFGGAHNLPFVHGGGPFGNGVDDGEFMDANPVVTPYIEFAEPAPPSHYEESFDNRVGRRRSSVRHGTENFVEYGALVEVNGLDVDEDTTIGDRCVDLSDHLTKLTKSEEQVGNMSGESPINHRFNVHEWNPAQYENFRHSYNGRTQQQKRERAITDVVEKDIESCDEGVGDINERDNSGKYLSRRRTFSMDERRWSTHVKYNGEENGSNGSSTSAERERKSERVLSGWSEVDDEFSESFAGDDEATEDITKRIAREQVSALDFVPSSFLILKKDAWADIVRSGGEKENGGDVNVNRNRNASGNGCNGYNTGGKRYGDFDLKMSMSTASTGFSGNGSGADAEKEEDIMVKKGDGEELMESVRRMVEKNLAMCREMRAEMGAERERVERRRWIRKCLLWAGMGIAGVGLVVGVCISTMNVQLLSVGGNRYPAVWL